MIQVNFLPQRFVEQRARRRRAWRQSALLGLALAGMIGWLLHSNHQLVGMQRYAGSLADQAEAAHRQRLEVNRLQTRQADLLRQVTLRRKLTAPVEPSQVLAVIAQQMPPSLAITSLGLTYPRLEPTKAPPPGAAKPRAAPRRGSAPPAKPVETPRLRLSLEGLAPDHGAVADFVERLSRHKLVEQVKLDHSRPVEVGDLRAHTFTVQIDIALDRDYQWDSASQEVARAQ